MNEWKILNITTSDDRKAVALALYLSGYEVRQNKRKENNKTVVFVEYRERSTQCSTTS